MERTTNRTPGFTLIELVLVLTVIGILAAVAVPRLLDMQREAARKMTVRSIQAVIDAAVRFHAEQQKWPVDAVHGTMPTELIPYLRNDVFDSPTPLDGLYDWSLGWGAAPFNATMSVFWPTGFPQADCLLIDGELDDGQPDAGRIQYSGANGGQGAPILRG